MPLAELMPTVFPDLTFVRVVRANKVRQAVSLWKAVQTATWREDQASAKAASVEEDGSPPYRSFVEEHRPQLRFHYRAIDHLLEGLLIEEASWDAFFEHSGIKPILVLYENFAADYETSTLNLLERLDLSPPDGFEFEPRMKRQSDRSTTTGPGATASCGWAGTSTSTRCRSRRSSALSWERAPADAQGSEPLLKESCVAWAIQVMRLQKGGDTPSRHLTASHSEMCLEGVSALP